MMNTNIKNELTEIRRENLRQWFADKPLPPEEKSYISQLIRGKASFGEKSARRIEETYGMPLYYLDNENNFSNKKIFDSYRVDVLDVSASAGTGVMLKDEFIETVYSIEYTAEEGRKIFNGRSPNDIKMITVQGDSMLGTLDPGDHVFVDVTVNEFKGDGIYIFVLDNELFVKRLQSQRNKIAVISDNKAYDTWYLEGSERQDIRILAKVLLSQSIEYKKHG